VKNTKLECLRKIKKTKDQEASMSIFRPFILLFFVFPSRRAGIRILNFGFLFLTSILRAAPPFVTRRFQKTDPECQIWKGNSKSGKACTLPGEQIHGLARGA